MLRTFSSLSHYNYRCWASGALFANIGTWMQRTAQDWLVLTQLSHNDARAMATVIICQFIPQILFLPYTGFIADRFDCKRVVYCTQTAMAALSLGLGLLVLSGTAVLWEVYAFAFLFGTAVAFDTPARQNFISEIVPHDHLANAVSLNGASFNGARMIGPAIAGFLIHWFGTGPVFIINAASYGFVFLALLLMRAQEIAPRKHLQRARGNFVGGMKYIAGQAELKTVFFMQMCITPFAVNFNIFIATMAVQTFHKQAGEFGLLMSFMSVGTIIGAFLVGSLRRINVRLMNKAAIAFAVMCTIAACMPNYLGFACVLMAVGLATQTFQTGSISFLQIHTEDATRGRVMAITMGLSVGVSPIAAFIVGHMNELLGARWSFVVPVAFSLLAWGLGLRYRYLKVKRVRAQWNQRPTSRS